MGNIYLCPKDVFYYTKALKQLKTKGRVWMTSFFDDWFSQYLVSIKTVIYYQHFYVFPKSKKLQKIVAVSLYLEFIA